MPKNLKKTAKQERMERAEKAGMTKMSRAGTSGATKMKAEKAGARMTNAPRLETNPGWLEYYAQRIQYEAYDRVLVTETAIMELNRKLARLSEGRLLEDARYHMERPALTEFVVQTEDNGNLLRILFRPSRYEGRELPKEAYTHNVPGERVEAWVDMFLESRTEKGSLRLALVLAKIPKGESDTSSRAALSSSAEAPKSEDWTGFVVVVWTDSRELEYAVVQTWSDVAYNLYYAVQKIMHERPEYFVTVSERMVPATRRAGRTTPAGKRKAKKQKRNMVKVRSLRLDLEGALRGYEEDESEGLSENVKSEARAERKYRCERWGVSGHYRHLKSGKVIWVRPYEKGAKRNEEGEV